MREICVDNDGTTHVHLQYDASIYMLGILFSTMNEHPKAPVLFFHDKSSWWNETDELFYQSPMKIQQVRFGSIAIKVSAPDGDKTLIKDTEMLKDLSEKNISTLRAREYMLNVIKQVTFPIEKNEQIITMKLDTQPNSVLALVYEHFIPWEEAIVVYLKPSISE